MPDQKVCAGLLYGQTHSAIMRTENGDKSNNYCLCTFVYRTSPSVSDNCRSLPIGVTCYFFFSFTADQNNHSSFRAQSLWTWCKKTQWRMTVSCDKNHSRNLTVQNRKLKILMNRVRKIHGNAHINQDATILRSFKVQT